MTDDDKLLRLECYKMADRPLLAPEVVIENARKIEAYILGSGDAAQPDEESAVDRLKRKVREKAAAHDRGFEIVDAERPD